MIMKPMINKRKRRSYAPAMTIAVDVDGTLIDHGILNEMLIEYLMYCKGLDYRLMLWSSRGKEYALGIVDQYGLADLFDDVVSKPGFIIDDRGWDWIKYTRIITDYGEIPEAEAEPADVGGSCRPT